MLFARLPRERLVGLGHRFDEVCDLRAERRTDELGCDAGVFDRVVEESGDDHVLCRSRSGRGSRRPGWDERHTGSRFPSAPASPFRAPGRRRREPPGSERSPYLSSEPPVASCRFYGVTRIKGPNVDGLRGREPGQVAERRGASRRGLAPDQPQARLLRLVVVTRSVAVVNGLRFVEIHHNGHRIASPEEAAFAFQGQEAPVYSMASSSRVNAHEARTFCSPATASPDG